MAALEPCSYELDATPAEVASLTPRFWQSMIDDGFFERMGARFMVSIHAYPITAANESRIESRVTIKTLGMKVTLDNVSTLSPVGTTRTQVTITSELSGFGAGAVTKALGSTQRRIQDYVQAEMGPGIEALAVQQRRTTATRPSVTL